MTRVAYDLETLRRAASKLLEAGFVLPDVPVTLAIEGVVLVAYNHDTDEGALIQACELSAFAHYVVAHLRRGELSPKPFASRDEIQKLEAFVARLVVGVETSSAGNREALLSKAAYTLGGLVGGGQVGQAHAVAQLEGAAVVAGLPVNEARGAVSRNLRKGQAAPWQFGSGRSRVGV